MKTKLYSQILAALLVLATSSAPIQAHAKAVDASVNDPVAALSPLNSQNFNSNSNLWLNIDVALDSNRIQDAINLIDPEIQKNPWNVELYYFKEEILQRGKASNDKVIEQMNIALNAVDKAISEHPGAAQLEYLKANILRTAKQSNEKVIEQLNTAMTLAGKHSDVYIYSIKERGEIYYGMNDLKSADKDFDVYLQDYPGDDECMHLSVEIKTQLQDWQGVIEDYTIQIRCDPQHLSKPYFARAAVEEKIGMWKQAKKDRETAEKLRADEESMDDGY